MTVTIIRIGADHDVSYLGAADRDGNYQNSGTCTYALKDADGNAVSGGTGTLSYVAASNGNYLGVIESTVTATLTAGATYYLEITFSKSTLNDFRRLRCRAEYREDV